MKKQTIFNPIKRLFGVNSKLIAIGKMLEWNRVQKGETASSSWQIFKNPSDHFVLGNLNFYENTNLTWKSIWTEAS